MHGYRHMISKWPAVGVPNNCCVQRGAGAAPRPYNQQPASNLEPSKIEIAFELVRSSRDAATRLSARAAPLCARPRPRTGAPVLSTALGPKSSWLQRGGGGGG
jgi:hypothetical protein